MLCAKPIVVDGQPLPVPCGRCVQCRLNKRQFWVGRLLLESDSPGYHFFVTLTYDDHNVPVVMDEEYKPWLTLRPEDVIGFLKRYRKRYGELRYFCVGEYGDRTQRPHYHLILFNQPVDEVECRCNRAWQWRGWVSVGMFNEARARYVAQYTVKKLSKGHEDLGPRVPEFARMSKYPPLGNHVMEGKMKQLISRDGCLAVIPRGGDVPKYYRIDGNWYPIGRYWVDRMRDAVGYAAPDNPYRKYVNGQEDLEEKRAAFSINLKKSQDIAKARGKSQRRKARV